MRMIVWAAALALAACSPPQSAPQADTAPREPEITASCNTLAPDMGRLVRVDADAVQAAADLRGGPLAPGVYDLVRATRVDAATGWADARAVTLDVAEGGDGAIVLNWVSAAPDGAPDRWSANFTETPAPTMTYTCGRAGAVSVAFAVNGAELTLRLPDGGAGALSLVFLRRG